MLSVIGVSDIGVSLSELLSGGSGGGGGGGGGGGSTAQLLGLLRIIRILRFIKYFLRVFRSQTVRASVRACVWNGEMKSE